MIHTQFLRIKKLTGKAIIEVAARHNLREILAEMGAAHDSPIDPARTANNIILRGGDTAAMIMASAQFMMNQAGVGPLRKDAVRALEIVVSLPVNSTIDQGRFFDDAVAWVDQHFGARVISAAVHNDEAAPHCHVLLLPLVDGRMIGSDLMGGKAKLQTMQADFHNKVGQPHGLTRQTAQKRPGAAIRRQAIDSALAVLEAHSGLTDAVLRALLEPHLIDPAPLLAALNLDMPVPKAIKGGFVKLMTRPCRVEKTPIGFETKIPIGFAHGGAH
jgi:hypothetical protein